MKKILLLILINLSLFGSQKITLQELVAISSSYTKLPIVLDKSLNNDLYIYTNTALTASNVNNILIDVLKNNGLRFVRHKTYYLLELIKKEKSLNRFIEIKYLTKDKIKNIMQFFKQDYLFINNKVMFTSLYNNYRRIKKVLNSFDVPRIQKKLKIAIIETNFNKLKEYGIKYAINHSSSDANIKINLGNLISNIGTVTNGLDLSINALIENGVSKIITNPIITIRNNENTTFNVTKTIPVIHTINTVNTDNKTVNSNKISYDSFGIKINVLPIINKNINDLQLSLSLQDIENDKNNMPTTSDKLIKQRIIIKDNIRTVLSGFYKYINNSSNSDVPYLSDIPVLGYFFKYKSNKNLTVGLQIILTVLNE